MDESLRWSEVVVGSVVSCSYFVFPFFCFLLARLRLFVIVENFQNCLRLFEISFAGIKICNREPSFAKPRYKKISEIISRYILRYFEVFGIIV